ncbi:hypothetical protein FP568_08405 [Pandoraea pnomenusa]|uniref:hypothetical protein n=1 Tax=Pandoraea pnomenusa TaxID=93220 RepID=UPI001198C94D|nr:hypothetical protein [Pandoraea pnomenusa]QDX21272.1 hypothetical protein FP568_08405 [Pandoraea pnomenusa]
MDLTLGRGARNATYFALNIDLEGDVAVTPEFLEAHGDAMPASIPVAPFLAVAGDALICMIDGAAVPSMTRPLTQDEVDNPTSPIDVRYPGDVLRALEDGVHDFTYRCETPDGALIGTSLSALVAVALAPPPLQLTPPQVSYAESGQLDPMQALDGANVAVRYEDMRPGHRIQVHWRGTPGAGSVDSPWQTIPPGGTDYLMFPVAPEVIAANIGADVSASYTVERSFDTAESPDVAFRVSFFSYFDLPTPQLPELGGGNRIEPDKLPNGLSVTLRAWPLAFPGQRLWLWLDGVNAESPDTYVLYVKSDYPMTADDIAQGVSGHAPHGWLAPLEHGTQVYLRFEVAFHDGERQPSRQLQFDVFNP